MNMAMTAKKDYRLSVGDEDGYFEDDAGESVGSNLYAPSSEDEKAVPLEGGADPSLHLPKVSASVKRTLEKTIPCGSVKKDPGRAKPATGVNDPDYDEECASLSSGDDVSVESDRPSKKKKLFNGKPNHSGRTVAQHLRLRNEFPRLSASPYTSDGAEPPSAKRSLYRSADAINRSRLSLIAGDDSAVARDAICDAEIRGAGKAEYKAMNLLQRRETIFKYYNIQKGINPNTCRKATVDYFVKVRGWPRNVVAARLSAYIDHEQMERKKGGGLAPKFDRNVLCVKFRERLAEVGGIRALVNVSQFAAEMGCSPLTVAKAIQRDPALNDETKRMRNETETRYEAKRSLVIAKFIEFTGDYRARRNACVRHFWKTPGFGQVFVMSACNMFLRYGSIREQRKNLHTQWMSEEMKIDKKNLEPKPCEIEFLQSLDSMQTEVVENFNKDCVKKRAREPTYDCSSTGNVRDEAAELAKHRAADARTLAAVQAQNAKLQVELNAMRDALEMAQRRIHILESAAGRAVAPQQPGWNANTVLFNGSIPYQT